MRYLSHFRESLSLNLFTGLKINLLYLHCRVRVSPQNCLSSIGLIPNKRYPQFSSHDIPASKSTPSFYRKNKISKSLSLSAAVFSCQGLQESKKVESRSRTLKKLLFLEYACDTNKLNKILCSRKSFGTHSTKLLKVRRFPKSDKLSPTFLFSVWVAFLSALRSTDSDLFSPNLYEQNVSIKVRLAVTGWLQFPFGKFFFQISLMVKEQAFSACCFEKNQRCVANLSGRKLNVM